MIIRLKKLFFTKRQKIHNRPNKQKQKVKNQALTNQVKNQIIIQSHQKNKEKIEK